MQQSKENKRGTVQLKNYYESGMPSSFFEHQYDSEHVLYHFLKRDLLLWLVIVSLGSLSSSVNNCYEHDALHS